MNYLKTIGLTIMLGCLNIHSVSAQQQETYFTHTISKGETLYSIASMYNVTREDLIRLNPSCASIVRLGETIKIPQRTTASSGVFYTIKKGDTLYGVARKYGITVEKLMVANPGVTAQTFGEGKVIRIPNTVSSNAAPAAEKKPLSSNCKEIHKAKWKDTPEKVAEKYNISLQALMDANPEMKKVGYKMQKGDLLCIPYPAAQASKVNPTWNIPSAKPMALLKVGVLLPFKSESKMEQDRMIEYYRGILMAVDSLKTLGKNVEVYAYNSGKTPADMQSVLANANVQTCNLIFGPYYADQLPVLAEFSNRINCTVVAPFSGLNDKIYSCKNLYLVNPPKSYQYGNVYDGFVRMFKGQNIILYSTSGGTTEAADFIIGLKQALRTAGIMFQIMPEHASEQQMLKLVDLQKNNVIVPTSYGIAALNTVMTKFKAFMAAHPSYQFQLFGYPDWQAFQQYHLNNFYFMDTFIYTSFYNVSWRKKNLKFVDDYEKNFHTEMLNTHPKYPMLGFDTGFYFMNGMATYGSSFSYHLKDIKTDPYQNAFSFHRVNNWGGFVNDEVKFIHYTRKKTTEILDFTK